MTETYWVGDLCYVLTEDWKEICNLTFPNRLERHNGLFELKDGRKFVMFGTAHGDGCYQDQAGGDYPVDSGSIGAIRLSDIRNPEDHRLGLGEFHSFSEDPETVFQNSYCKNGMIVIGNKVFIETDDLCEEDFEDYEWEDPYLSEE